MQDLCHRSVVEVARRPIRFDTSRFFFPTVVFVCQAILSLPDFPHRFYVSVHLTAATCVRSTSSAHWGSQCPSDGSPHCMGLTHHRPSQAATNQELTKTCQTSLDEDAEAYRLDVCVEYAVTKRMLSKGEGELKVIKSPSGHLFSFSIRLR